MKTRLKERNFSPFDLLSKPRIDLALFGLPMAIAILNLFCFKDIFFMFGVVIPAYNCERTMFSALKSILLQSRLDLIEGIIVVNDWVRRPCNTESYLSLNPYCESYLAFGF